ncbi:MAG TPA: CpaF family protein [Candidatus Sulfotelmatobacter sp.]|jgi:pilus assembly protein CpaF|nr:CpaF family protein [Candidatus Sulfotelmatobacter sp.]
MNIDRELKSEVRIETGMRFGRNLPNPAEARNAARTILDAKLKQHRRSLESSEKETLLDNILYDLLGFGPLEPLLQDNTVTEIMVNGPRQIFVERHGKKTLSDIEFDDEGHLRTILDKMLILAARRLDESSPYVDFSLKDGSRINAIIAPLAVDGSSITIRKFLDTLKSPDDLVRLETISVPMAAFLRAAIRARLNIMFAGATGAGKTATLNVLSNEIAPDERIVTIEDALELKLNQRHVVRLLTRANNIEGKGAIGVRQLFSNTLRMRPSRIILGEIRGEEALDYLQAVNSGHDGTLAVLHASTPADVVGRLETMAMYSQLGLPSSEIRRQIASGLSLIIQHEQFNDGARKITRISELGGMKDGEVVINDIFRFDITGTSPEGRTLGEFKLVSRPQNTLRFQKRGVPLDDIFPEA